MTFSRRSIHSQPLPGSACTACARGGQLQHLHLVQRGDGLEVEAVEALGRRE